ncbi:hypothetical protein O181_096195 [Austropuccinia psidii MF-1]|uniref:Uncharacterized protein n=1 Tax=Austropuccinia psidii MF-1 TaxID=1389203 RepID=A0A9Q3J755_9BASI|nr:hypothetical protein [Austropuccinia psidii MF-1]
MKKDKPREPLKPNNTNEKRKCHKYCRIGKLANSCLKKAKINEIAETEEHNDKEESDSKKDTEESETSQSEELNTINSPIKTIDLIYEVLNVNSNFPQIGTSNKWIININEAKLHRTQPAKGMGYTSGKSSISIVLVNYQEEKVNLNIGAHFTCVGKSI